MLFPEPSSISLPTIHTKTLELKRGAEDFSGCEGLHLPLSMQNQQTLSLQEKKYKFLPFENITEAAAPQLFRVYFLWTAWSCDIVYGGRLARAWWWEGTKNMGDQCKLCCLTCRGQAVEEAVPVMQSDGWGQCNRRAEGWAFLSSLKQAYHCWPVNTILHEKRQRWALKTVERSEKNKARGIHSNWMKF